MSKYSFTAYITGRGTVEIFNISYEMAKTLERMFFDELPTELEEIVIRLMEE